MEAVPTTPRAPGTWMAYTHWTEPSRGSNPVEFLEYEEPTDTCPPINTVTSKKGFGLPCALLAQQFSALWYDFALGRHDDTAMARAAIGDRGIFMPIGTRGDLVMEILSMSDKLINVSGEELGPQLLAAFDSDGQISTLLQPGRLTPTTATAREGPDSHGVVYRDPGTSPTSRARFSKRPAITAPWAPLSHPVLTERNAAFHSLQHASPRPACRRLLQRR